LAIYINFKELDRVYSNGTAVALTQEQQTNQFKGGRTMRANGHVLRGQEIPAVSDVLHALREWAREKTTQGKIAEVCVVAGSFALVGYVLLVLHVAMQNSTIAGF
jgi:hypothetical protein